MASSMLLRLSGQGFAGIVHQLGEAQEWTIKQQAKPEIPHEII
jgi:hypothetical protein